MRSFISAAAVILGLLLTAVAIPGLWLDRNVVREDGFVALAAPLGTDARFQEKMAAATVASLDVEQLVPVPLQPAAQELLNASVQSLAGLPGYSRAWEETLSRSHRLSFAAGEASTSPGQNQVTSLTLDVSPLVGLVTNAIGSGVGQAVEAPGQVLIHIGESEHRLAIERLTLYAPLAYPLAAAASVAFLLGLLAARRRWLVLLGTGAGMLVLAAVWTLGIGLGQGVVLGRTSGNEVADLFASEFMTAATADFSKWVQWFAIAGAALLAVAILLKLFSRRRHRPGA